MFHYNSVTAILQQSCCATIPGLMLPYIRIVPLRKQPIIGTGEYRSIQFRCDSWGTVEIIRKLIPSVCSIILGLRFIVDTFVAVYDLMSSLL